MSLLGDLWLWFWRLLPANPILVRVVSAAGKRTRHLHARWAYLAALFGVMIVVGNSLFQSASLSVLAKQSTHTFVYVSLVQLLLMSFIAPVFTAGAITQEKDSNTFHILLTTPLSNGQIVLGTLFSRLYFVWVMLLSGLPIFCITMIFGGVTLTEVWQSLLLAACTGLVTGALAIMISVMKVGTRRTIFSFFLGVAVYLLGVGAIGLSPWGALPEAPAGAGTVFRGQMSWLAPVHPFLALMVVTGQTPAPEWGELGRFSPLLRWMLTQPHLAYAWLTTLASALMILISLFFLRRGAREGESTLINRLTGAIRRNDPSVEKRRKPRRVWNNPIAWREANTRASAGGRSAMRWVFVAGGVFIGLLLVVAHYRGWWGMNPANPAATQGWLVSLIWIELAVILLVVTNTAATTLTREKEMMTQELLLVSPLTSKYIVSGMQRGLVSFVLPLIAVPTFTVLAFAVADLVSPQPNVTTPESVILTPLLMISFVALAALVGLNQSLQSRKMVQAVMISTAIVMGVSLLLWACGQALLGGGQAVAAIVMPFTPFPAIHAAINPLALFNSPATPPDPAAIASARWMRLIFSLVSAGVYAGLTIAFHNTMVRNFDMTVRRQSA